MQSANESRRFYEDINSQRKSINPRLNMCRAVDGSPFTTRHDVQTRFKEHFDSLYNEEAEEEATNDESFLSDDGRKVAAPTWEEVSAAISSPKNNKAAGPDNIPAKLLKMGSSSTGLIHLELRNYTSSSVRGSRYSSTQER